MCSINHNRNSSQMPAEESPVNRRPFLFLLRQWVVRHPKAAVLFATPFVLALPIAYWVFYVVDGSLVTTRLESRHRLILLQTTYAYLMLSLIVLVMFPAFLQLFRERYYRILTGICTLIFGVLFLPAVLFVVVFALSLR